MLPRGFVLEEGEEVPRDSAVNDGLNSICILGAIVGQQRESTDPRPHTQRKRNQRSFQSKSQSLVTVRQA